MLVQRVFSGGVVDVHEVWCDDQPEPETSDELSSASQVVLPHHGVFVRHVFGREVVATSAVAIFYNDGEVGRISHPVAHRDASTVLTPTDRVLDSIVPADGAFPQSARPVTGGFALLHSRLRRHLRRSAGDVDRLAVEEIAVELMAGAVGIPIRTPSIPVSARQRRVAGHVQARLATGFRDDVSLTDLAADTGASVFEVSRAVNRTTGRSVTDLRTWFRLRHAIEHLDDDDMSLSALAVESGFSDQSHMTRTFGRLAGTTPACARRSLTSVPRKIVQDR